VSALPPGLCYHRGVRLVCLASMVSLTLWVGACTRVNAQYCDEQTPCSVGTCDYGTRSCLHDGDGGGPADAAPDAMLCESSAMCSATAPICDEGDKLCRGCQPTGGDAPECQALDPATPQCNDDGRCVECASNAVCSGIAPICDQAERACRPCAASGECTESGFETCAPDGACVGCVEHADCPSDVCDPRGRQCAEAASVVYVGGQAAADNPLCGTSELPCATVQFALDDRVTATRDIVRLRDGNYDAALFSGIDVLVTGSAANLRGAESGQPVVEVGSNATVYLDGIVIRSGYGSTSAHGVECNGSGSSLTLRNVEVRLNAGRGIDSDCDLTIAGGTVDGNAGVALAITGGTVHIDGLTATANQGGGLNIQGAGFRVVNSIIARNGDPQATVSGVRIANFDTLSPQVLAFNTIADNITSGTTPAYGVYCDVVNGSTATFRSNIVWGGSGPSLAVSGSCPFTYSNVTGGLTGEGNMEDDPLFVGSGDYHITGNSPVVGKGSPVTGVDRDIDGDLRDDSPDIGADEL
jgi:hypothetical protein